MIASCFSEGEVEDGGAEVPLTARLVALPPSDAGRDEPGTWKGTMVGCKQDPSDRTLPDWQYCYQSAYLYRQVIPM